ncbi:hypothetical protein [Beduini massiliensis]|uniref:hypothetical protein n=1 Tax=Beduini massiliensis TaxID=1585974 RepID=UPI00059A9492|nr:hypothetical protein [Beduini massiliensis]
MALKDLMKKFKKEEAIEERIDPVIEQRRKEKFSSPLIYNEEQEEVKAEAKKAKPVEKVQIKKPKIDTAVTPFYSMSEIISPMTGKKEEAESEYRPAVKKIKKKRTTNYKEQLVPVISPFYGAQEEQIEVDEELSTKKVIVKKSKEKTENKKPDSVTENLRNLANIIKEEENQLKIIEARTGEFQLDFSGVQGEEKTLIDEINDEMTLDELMSLYEKKKLKE